MPPVNLPAQLATGVGLAISDEPNLWLAGGAAPAEPLVFDLA